MEIYKDLSNPASQEFEKLLNSQLSKVQIEEGKIIEGKINKITEKFVFLFVEGLKSEPVLDINELKSMGLSEKIKVGEKFIDKGFISTTRDPFYSPGIDGEFGLILLKINIPKNKKGVGLFIENFSMFPQEEEFLLVQQLVVPNTGTPN